MPGRNSPYGIQVDSPDQRQWMSFDVIGSIRRTASIVCGAAGSQRALNWRSPTLIVSLPIDRRIRATVEGVADPAGATPTISTHVLDTENGLPAAGVHVSLYKLGEDDRPIRLTQALTDGDGRVRDLLDRPMSAGTYRLEFNLASPRGPAKGDDDRRFFRRMSVDLRIDDVSRSYHVPLLLAPFSMTTYRGS